MNTGFQAVKLALEDGLVCSVWDGEEWAVKKSKNRHEIWSAVLSVEEAEVRVRDPQTGKIVTTMLIIPHGVAPNETLCNYTISEWTERRIEPLYRMDPDPGPLFKGGE